MRAEQDLLFMSGGAYRPGDLEVGISQAPSEGTFSEAGEIGLIPEPVSTVSPDPDSDLMKTGLTLA